MQLTLNLKNHFLIAMPSLNDPNFQRTVTYICEHDDNGAMGLILSRATGTRLSELFQQLDISCEDPEINNRAIMAGGPVGAQNGFILHRPPGQWETSLQITNELGLTTSRDILESIALGNGPKDIIITLGYAGWGAGQLEQELATNAWLTHPAETDLIFSTPTNQLWQAAANALGVDLNLLSGESGHA